MKIKWCIFFLILFLLTGCDAVYNLNIDDEVFNEDATVIEKNPNNWHDSNENNVTFYNLLMEEYDRDNGFYRKTFISTDTEKGLNYVCEFDQQDYSAMSLPSRCYQYFNVIEEDDTIIISTSNKNLCYDYYKWLENITINFTTNHEVLYSNADEIKDSTYTWKLTRQNASDKNIQIKISKNVETKENFWANFIRYIPIVITMIVVAAIIGIIVIILKISQSRANKI